MDVRKTVLECMVDITGLNEESIGKIESENLFKMGILNSLSLGSLVNMIEDKLDIKIDIKKCKLADFESVDSIVKIVSTFVF